jgi:hypothetical protein
MAFEIEINPGVVGGCQSIKCERGDDNLIVLTIKDVDGHTVVNHMTVEDTKWLYREIGMVI